MSASDVQETAKSDNEALEWRKERFEELGFSELQIVALAKSVQIEYTGAGTDSSPRREWRQPLDWKKVQKALENGCTKDMALQIFSTYGE